MKEELKPIEEKRKESHKNSGKVENITLRDISVVILSYESLVMEKMKCPRSRDRERMRGRINQKRARDWVRARLTVAGAVCGDSSLRCYI